MYEINLDESESKIVLRFNEPLTIQNILDIREAIISSIDKAGNLVIDHGSIEDFDSSYLQLLIAAKRSIELSGKKMTIKGTDGDAFHKLLEETACLSFKKIIEENINIESGVHVNG